MKSVQTCKVKLVVQAIAAQAHVVKKYVGVYASLIRAALMKTVQATRQEVAYQATAAQEYVKCLYALEHA